MGDIKHTVGIDGCAAGWIIAAIDRVIVTQKLNLDEFELIGIDMPIGLVDGPPRACDIAARKFLGRAGSSVFPAPPRAALPHADYRAALLPHGRQRAEASPSRPSTSWRRLSNSIR